MPYKLARSVRGGDYPGEGAKRLSLIEWSPAGDGWPVVEREILSVVEPEPTEFDNLQSHLSTKLYELSRVVVEMGAVNERLPLLRKPDSTVFQVEELKRDYLSQKITRI